MAGRVRAKMVCTSNEPYQDGNRVVFAAVTSGSEENESFFKYTPCATLDMSIVNPAAAAVFEKGKTYYLDLTPAE